MKKITFGLVSLIFSLFDFKVGVSVTSIIYGIHVSNLFYSFPFNLVYFALIFTIEFMTIRAFVSLFEGILRKLYLKLRGM
jgi:TRAP-type C4-dicarboxylate transport system permease small subunit